MNGYLAILKIRMKVLVQYRAAAFAGICTQAFWGIIQVMILTAFFKEGLKNEPITLSQAVTFMWLAQALLQILPWNIDKEIEAQVRTGNIAYELLRPLHLYTLWFMRAFAMRLIPTLLRAFPIFILGGLFFGLQAPASFEAFSYFILAVILSLFVASAITTLIIISLFWTLSGEGIQRLSPHLFLLLSGMVVPLPLFPNWLKPFLDIQPIRCVMDIPCRLYTGVIPASEALYFLGFQCFWFFFFVLLGKYLLQKALRQFVIQGG